MLVSTYATINNNTQIEVTQDFKAGAYINLNFGVELGIIITLDEWRAIQRRVEEALVSFILPAEVRETNTEAK